MLTVRNGDQWSEEAFTAAEEILRDRQNGILPEPAQESAEDLATESLPVYSSSAIDADDASYINESVGPPGSRVRGFFRGIKRSVVAAAILLAWDGAISASYLMSAIFCPIWFLVSLLTNAIERPGWRLALVRIGIPVWTLGLVSANNAVQLGVAEANAQRVVAACEQFHAANGRFPEKLDELVPHYINSVPIAKYCLGPSSCFYYYSNSGTPLLYWQVVPPQLRKIYHFKTHRWTYLD
jgi:hypothetical protein